MTCWVADGWVSMDPVWVQCAVAPVVSAIAGGTIYGEPQRRPYLADLRIELGREQDFEARMTRSIADALDEEWLEVELV